MMIFQLQVRPGQTSPFDNLPQRIQRIADQVIREFSRMHPNPADINPIVELIQNHCMSWIRTRGESPFARSLDSMILADNIRRIGSVVNHPQFETNMTHSLFRLMFGNIESTANSDTISTRVLNINRFSAILDAFDRSETFKRAIAPILANYSPTIYRMIDDLSQVARIINTTTDTNTHEQLGRLTAQALSVTAGSGTHTDQRPFAVRDLRHFLTNNENGRTENDNVQIAVHVAREYGLAKLLSYNRYLRGQIISATGIIEFIDLVEHTREPFRDFMHRRYDYIFRGGENAIQNIVSSFAIARRLLTELRENPTDNELVFNFAYAIANIGINKTRALANVNGIRYFCRYTTELLLETYQHTLGRVVIGEARGSRAYLIAHGRDDWNGSFYHNAGKNDVLRRGYRVVIIEDSNDNSLFRRALLMRRRVRMQFIDGTIAGHGNANGIQLGRRPGDATHLDVNDSEIRTLLPQIFRPGGRITLISCSTGRNPRRYSIGELISDVLGDVVYAPPINASLTGYTIDTTGRVNGARFVRVARGLDRIVPSRR